MKTICWIPWGVALVATVLQGSAMAQAPAVPHAVPQDVRVLDTVVVKALKEALTLEETAASVAHFDEQAIERRSAAGLGDLFRYEPGVSVEEGAAGTFKDIRIRGIGADRVLLLVDDVPLPSTYEFNRDISTSRNFFDLDAMKSVDVVKSPLSTLYGGSALAGGVFMRTKDPEDFIAPGEQFGGEARVGWQTGSREWLAGITAAAHLGENASAMLRLTERGGHERANHVGRGSGHDSSGKTRERPNPADTRMHNLLAKAVYNAGTDHRFSLSYERFRDRLDEDLRSELGPGKVMPNIVPVPPLFPYEQLDYRTRNLTQRDQWALRHEFSNSSWLFDQGFWQLDYQRNDSVQENEELRRMASLPPIPGIAGQLRLRTREARFRQRSLGLIAGMNKEVQTASVQHHLSHGLSLRRTRAHSHRDGDSIDLNTGLSVENETLPTQGEPDSTITEAGAYVQDRMVFGDGRVELVAGLRYDHYRLTPDKGGLYESSNPLALTPSSVRAGRLSKRLALLYHPAEAHTLFVHYSEGFKAPAFSDVNTSYVNDAFRVVRQANPDLKPETSRMLELGWNYREDHRYFSLVGFHTRYRNFIEFRPVGTNAIGYTVSQTVNLDRSRIYGLEFKTGLDLPGAVPRGVLGLSLSGAWARGRDLGTHQPIDSVDPPSLSAGVNWRDDDRWFLEARLKTVAAKRESQISQTLKNQGVTRSPGYTTLDVFAEYKPHRSLVLNASVQNLLNRKYWSWNQRQYLNADAVHRHTQSGIHASLTLKYLF